MAETAFETRFREETVAAFEVGASLLRDAVTTEATVKGNIATFLVAGSGGATAKTRGVNGLIPARGNSLAQTPITLVEWHDLVEITSFNIFASQGNQRAIMQKNTLEVINRRIDYDILTELDTATVDTGAATTASTALVMKASAILQLAQVPWDADIYGVVSPSFMGYLSQTKEFTSADYVDMKPLPSNGPAWVNRPKVWKWMNVTWILHPSVPGVGTSSESCFLFHKSAIGHAINTGSIMTAIGYEGKQDLSWARASAYMGTQNLQNAGIVKILHDGSAYVGS